MEKLNSLYTSLLHFGLLVLRQAIYSNNNDWAKLEIEMLHNIPSLIIELNIERHRCFWFIQRDLYIQRILALNDDEPKSRMRTYYDPIWREMEPIILDMLNKK
jgi:hypothetical protein